MSALGMIASRRKTPVARRGRAPRAPRLARFMALAYVLVAVAVSVAVCACVLLLLEPTRLLPPGQ
jgi:hypothetical protein